MELLPSLRLQDAHLEFRCTSLSFLGTRMSFLQLEGLHVFVTGAAGGIGGAIVDEFLCR